MTFLGKADIESGNAEKEAQALLKLSQKQRGMEDCLPRARRMIQDPPFPSLPDALIALVTERGFQVSRKEAEGFIRTAQHRVETPSDAAVRIEEEGELSTRQRDVVSLSPERPESLAFTSVDHARFGDQTADNWNALVCAGIKVAVERGCGINDLRRWLNAQVEEGSLSERGFHPVPGTNLSLQYMEANRAWENALALAKQLKCELSVDLRWRRNQAAAHPGQSGVLHWSPEHRLGSSIA